MVPLKTPVSEAEYRAALREASAFFENEPEPGTPEGDRFEALLAVIEAYETADSIAKNLADFAGIPQLAMAVLCENSRAMDSHLWLSERKSDASLRYILLVDASSPLAILYSRLDGTWESRIFRGLDSTIDVGAAKISLSAVYAGASFPAEAKAAAAIAAQGAKANCSRFRAVVFDVFGTLAEIGERRRPYLRLMKLAAAAGRQPQPDDAAKIMSMNCDIFGVADRLGLSLTAEMRADIEQDLAAEIASISLFSDAVPVIEYLRSQGIKIGLCSNLAQPYAAPVKDLLPDLDAYVFSFEVGAVKPDDRLFREIKFGTAQPAMAMYQAACEKLDLPPDQILMIGDSFAADVWGPRKFGMNARHLARRGGSPDADAVVSLLDLFAAESEHHGWQEIIDDQTGKRKWIPMALYEAYCRQQMAVRGRSLLR